MDGQVLRLSLALRFGRSSTALGRLLRDYGAAETVPADASYWQQQYLPSGLQHQGATSQAELQRLAGQLQQCGWHLVALGDPLYPALLTQIGDPPGVLFVRGDPDCLAAPQIAMVGARGASPEGLGHAARFARQLSGCGFVITSGLAYGIDAAAHQGALERGRTVAVMATGPDQIYPRRHAALAEKIIQAGGALVTEFPPGSGARRESFPQRNRIVSGLSLATVVVEAALRSGSLITARLACEQDREVFAVPGSLHNPLSRGCHRLLRDGANWLESVDDVLAVLPGFKALAAGLQEQESAPEDSLLGCFAGGLNSLDQLEQRSGLAIAELSDRLTSLELAGLVVRLPGGYVRA